MENKPKRILLLDDEPTTVSPLKDYLVHTFNWEVELTAEQKILERLKVERFDLILVDVMIQPSTRTESGDVIPNIHYDGVSWKKTGVVFIRRLRGGGYSGPVGPPADVPVVLLSAIADSVETDPSYEFSKTVKIVEKPFRLENLVKVIVSIIGSS